MPIYCGRLYLGCCEGAGFEHKKGLGLLVEMGSEVGFFALVKDFLRYEGKS